MTTIAADILNGLRLPQKTIPSKYFYDERGSALFEEICRLPEYYLTRTEQSILGANVRALAALLGERASLLEFGSGSSIKTRLLLSSAAGLGTYVPIDISGAFLLQEAQRLSVEYPTLRILPLCADFTGLDRLPGELETELADGTSRRVLFFPGSTIGNFDPGDALALLRRISRLIGDGGHLIVGVDLVKDTGILEAAYNDSSGVTAAFNRNILEVLNREFLTDFDVRGFEHRAFFNSRKSRVEMHLVSRRDQVVSIDGEVVRFHRDETIHTESSYKYGADAFPRLLRQAGFSRVDRWTDTHGLFGVYHAA